ncbi:MAG: tRNA (adenosine(37)-N6)-threonylcarbamoyltransferase complex transferase subunit TsaD [Clostridiales bacterium]|nr:tRNA (adenosine(37)-N6)-threonylcarbamoyltransferase complex transferase subunit TsaD [Clostridiales bacterium]
MYFDIAKEKAKNLIDKKSALILAIESSCDETSVAVVKDGRKILSNVISTQIPIHTLYGGVVPEIASRNHTLQLTSVTEEALKQANVSLDDIDAIAVTQGPGLIGALLTGVNYAKALAFSKKKVLIGVHHIQGHICANFLEYPELEPPFIALAVSGGHSHILKVSDYCDFSLLGATRDDAVGEAFDKVARVLGLGYPGGIKIDALAKEGNDEAYNFTTHLEKEDTYDFSFSGVKTAVVNLVHNMEQKGQEIPESDIAASFQKSVVRMLIQKAIKAAKDTGYDKIVLAGGVASNSRLREDIKRMCNENNILLYYPSPVLCTDNGAMIGSAAFYTLMQGKISDIDLNAFATGGLDEFYRK